MNKTKPRPRATRRWQIVMRVKRDHGLTLAQMAREMEFSSIGHMTSVLRSPQPHDVTLARLRDWLRRRGVFVEVDALNG